MSSPRVTREMSWLVPTTLVASVTLRVLLALQGGQYFFGDEGRYDRGIQLYQALAHGDWSAARAIIALPEHALFAWVGALVTAGQHLIAQFTPFGDWDNGAHIGFTIHAGAALLGLFSALNLYLLYRLVLAAGASEEEAGWALVLMAAANTGFYFSRHLLPYDCAISAILGALLVGLRRPTPAGALACGFLGGLTYHLYNGYWYAVPVIGLLYAMAHRRHPLRHRFSLLCVSGMAIAVSAPLAIGLAAGGMHYLETMAAFSRTVTQGLFAEGWSLPWEYFWHSEGLCGAAVASGLLLAMVHARRTGTPLPAHVRGALIAGGAAYLLLVLFSVGFGRFVVYARTVKPLVPLACVLGGWGLARLITPRPRLRTLVLAAIAISAGVRFSPHFNLVFPREVEIAVLRNWGNPKRSLSTTGSIYIPLAQPVTRPDLALVNAQLLYPVREYQGYPAGRTILTLDHALTYRPFQYECHTPRERALLRSHDISIRLIQLAAPDQVPDDLPPAQRYRNEDRPTGR